MNKLKLLTICLLLGMVISPNQNAWTQATTNTISTGKTVVACVGDSITHGDGKQNTYPFKLQQLLGDQWVVMNFGVGGRTLLHKGDHPYWNETAFIKAHQCNPNIVIIMLGTNDTKPQNWIHKDDFYADYKELIESFKALPSKPKIFLCLPSFVAGQGKFGITEENIQLELPIIKKLAAEEQLPLIDIHSVFQAHPELLQDGVHPNTEGRALFAKTVFQSLKGK